MSETTKDVVSIVEDAMGRNAYDSDKALVDVARALAAAQRENERLQRKNATLYFNAEAATGYMRDLIDMRISANDAERRLQEILASAALRGEGGA